LHIVGQSNSLSTTPELENETLPRAARLSRYHRLCLDYRQSKQQHDMPMSVQCAHAAAVKRKYADVLGVPFDFTAGQSSPRRSVNANPIRRCRYPTAFTSLAGGFLRSAIARAGNPDSKLVGIVITDAATTRAMPEPRGRDLWRECM
jgi:hypothetical protein